MCFIVIQALNSSGKKVYSSYPSQDCGVGMFSLGLYEFSVGTMFPSHKNIHVQYRLIIAPRWQCENEWCRSLDVQGVSPVFALKDVHWDRLQQTRSIDELI